MSFQIDRNTVAAQELADEMTTAQADAVWNDASDSELEARISKDYNYGSNYC